MKLKQTIGIIGLEKVGTVVKIELEFWNNCVGYDLGDDTIYHASAGTSTDRHIIKLGVTSVAISDYFNNILTPNFEDILNEPMGAV